MSLDTRAEYSQSVHIPHDEDSCEVNTSLLANDILVTSTNPAQAQQVNVDSIKNHSLEDTHIEDTYTGEKHQEYHEDHQLLTQILASHHNRNNYSQDTQIMNDDHEVISMDIEGNSTQKSRTDYTNINNFEQTEIQEKESDETPTQLNFKALADTQVISGDNATSREHTIWYRLSDLKDTQVIASKSRNKPENLPETQLINNSSRSRYNELGETQVIIRRRHQNLPDTQVISHDYHLKHDESSELLKDNHEKIEEQKDSTFKNWNVSANSKKGLYVNLPATQVITKPKLYSPDGDVTESDFENPFLVAESQPVHYEGNNLQQVSHRQVINTQDEPDTSLFLLKPHTLEVQTDEEKDASHVKDDDSNEAVVLNDSKDLIDHESNRQKRRLSHSPIKIKRSKTASIDKYADNYRHQHLVATPGDHTRLRNHSEPLVFASPFDKTFSTSSSSPSKRIADQLIRTDGDQTHVDITAEGEDEVKVENEELKSDSQSVLDNVSTRHISPPSSPDGINSMSLSESEEEDNELDADYIVTDNDNYGEVSIAEKTTSDERRIVPKRRVNNIVDSQTPSCDNILPTQDDEYTIRGVLRKEESNVIYEEDVVSKDSVWATYNLKMYSGYINARYGDYSIVDFDQESSRIKNEDLNPLDIRIGDTLNVKGKRFKCVVTGLSITESPSRIRCIRGYNLVYFKRNSKARKLTEDNEFVAAISECSMELGDWVMHQQKFQIKRRSKGDFDGTGGEFLPTPNLPMHPTTSEVNLTYPSTPSKLRHSTMTRPLSPSPKKGVIQTSLLFANRLFCITNIEDPRKHTLKNLIESNGGTYVDTNLMDLFQYTQRPQAEGGGLYLKSSYSVTNELIFAALISNNYCRSSKYLQALALGWPILSDCYIDDVINGMIDLEQWPAYCLPAGQSTKLNAVANCDLFKFRKNYELGKCLDFQMDLHSDLLSNYNVVIISLSLNEANKRSIIEMDTCKFIFHAFGARSLHYAELNTEDDGDVGDEFPNLVRRMHAEDDGNILVCDYRNNQISDLLYSIVDGSKSFSDKSKKRHRSKLKGRNDSIDFKIVDWEWVVQCVISGHIWQPSMTI